jgi:hypothetical protein
MLPVQGGSMAKKRRGQQGPSAEEIAARIAALTPEQRREEAQRARYWIDLQWEGWVKELAARDPALAEKVQAIADDYIREETRKRAGGGKTVELVGTGVRKVQLVWGLLDPPAQNAWLRRILERVVVGGQEKISIEPKYELALLIAEGEGPGGYPLDDPGSRPARRGAPTSG